jgi:uncharacterized protein with HEPN domain
MQAEERDAAHLWDMLEAVRAVLRFTAGLSLQDFLADSAELTRLAVERKLEILGEAARRTSQALRERHPQIPWREIIGLRNLISHEYEKVNYQAVYRIVREGVSELAEQLAPLVPPAPEPQE